MLLNVRRKVTEINLKPNEFLLPLYEVIVNAVHAIEDKNETNGLIKIEILRDESQKLTEDRIVEQPITSFIVTDNGIGFNKNAFAAFNDAYTEHKLAKGGKGVGRFTVLKAFDAMEVESRFVENGQTFEREFNFSVAKEIEETNPPNPSHQIDTGSVVTLRRYHYSFLDKSSISADALCEEIVNHCLVFFLTGSMPRVLVIDGPRTHELNDYYKRFLFGEKIDEVTIDDNKFKLYFLRKHTSKGSHQIHLCAHNRLVKTLPIKTIIPNLYRSVGNNGDSHYISIFVTGDYLNNNLNEIRNSFTFPVKDSEKNGDYLRNISLEQIEQVIKHSIETEYKNEISEVEEHKLAEIQEYVLSDNGIEYRHLLDSEEELAAISPENLSPEKLDTELHKINYQLEKKHKTEVSKVLSKSIENSEEYTQQLRKVLIDESKFTQSKLANYLIHRKVILNVFQKFLEWTEEGKYKKEEDLHNIIFPMGGDSDTVPFNKHNLWLLDERLTFHTYIASDKKNSSLKTITSDSGKETDLIIFDKRWAYSPDDEFSSLVIFEFKRPGRLVAKDVDDQVISYFKNMIEGIAKTYKGKMINIDEHTPKFGYIICEIDKDLKNDLIKWQNYKVTPNQTLYRYWDELNMYVEIMNFDQVCKSAVERHKAFFKMLGVD